MEKKKDKTTFERVIKCPYCEKELIVKNVKKLSNEPVKAEYDEELTVEKNTQQDLEDFKEK